MCLLLTINERAIGDVTILQIVGRITVQEGAEQFRDAMRRLVRDGRVKLVIDFHDATYIDSTALGEIIRAYTSTTRKGGSLKLLKVPKSIHQLLMITRLLTIFDLFDDEAQAVKSFGAARSSDP
jgi:anti-sigma B factor antagonist